jgi:hypothetical protein
MKFHISLGNDTLQTTMRSFGYTPDGQDQRTGQLRFFRSLSGRRYPRFHLYLTENDQEILLNLHLDQKQPSYSGSSAHSGEYEGTLVEQEAERIQSLAFKA